MKFVQKFKTSHLYLDNDGDWLRMTKAVKKSISESSKEIECKATSEALRLSEEALFAELNYSMSNDHVGSMAHSVLMCALFQMPKKTQDRFFKERILIASKRGTLRGLVLKTS